jgi:hypothetical protein
MTLETDLDYKLNIFFIVLVPGPFIILSVWIQRDDSEIDKKNALKFYKWQK